MQELSRLIVVVTQRSMYVFLVFLLDTAVVALGEPTQRGALLRLFFFMGCLFCGVLIRRRVSPRVAFVFFRPLSLGVSTRRLQVGCHVLG